MRVPHYELAGLTHGPLAPATVIKPRIAPPLFGVGLLEAVPERAISGEVTGTRKNVGRFGWQAASVSIRDQTTITL